MSTKAERSEAASLLGEQGRKLRWANTTQDERVEFAKQLAACRWPSYARALAEERDGDRLDLPATKLSRQM